MEPFYSLLSVMGLAVVCPSIFCFDFDIIGSLPPEIAITILRQLDEEALWAASRVSRRWSRLCRADAVLQRRLRQQEALRRRRAEARVWAVQFAAAPAGRDLQTALKVRNIRRPLQHVPAGRPQPYAAPASAQNTKTQKKSRRLPAPGAQGASLLSRGSSTTSANRPLRI
ncbi:uncharacterized protein LOC126299324 isoform X1 [Schistocerca gregaria]|uniref:uncharacterized protein LOC126299323 isoform X1 n=1 Tax=Schistocerca gregaria TaxID=7010 RepID=UPI00211F067A|nr:uncharacterized protein LOC126299323 isoform X1 [Schistocerca gregaria]XP_049847109.1 uncharacterized protein LOC126299324 isoform X1 [Schistocerca gregaria]